MNAVSTAETSARVRNRTLTQTSRTGSPLHPIFVHFTVALTSASIIFDLLSSIGAAVGETGWWMLAAAVVSTVMTVVTGVISRTKISVPESSARRFLRFHMALGPTLFGALLCLGVWRAVIWQNAWRPEGWYFAGAFVVFVLLFLQAYLGGELVYRFGMDVRGATEREGARE
jgi:uncharacterized membrane protein